MHWHIPDSPDEDGLNKPLDFETDKGTKKQTASDVKKEINASKAGKLPPRQGKPWWMKVKFPRYAILLFFELQIRLPK